MTHKECIAVALAGEKPDRIPIFPIYDMGYMATSTGRDIRDWATCSAQQRIQLIEDSFLLHGEIDGFVAHGGCNDDFVGNHQVEKFDEYWRVTSTATGEQYGLLPDGSRCSANGHPLPAEGEHMGWESKIQSPEDIDRFTDPVPTADEVEAGGRYWPIRHLAQKYPDYHFGNQCHSPMISALSWCGGYVEGLTTMASEPELFQLIMQRYVDIMRVYLPALKQAGAESTWFTSYYTGADTISPETYAEVIFPLDYALCQVAKEAGLLVLNWYLGDLMPNLDQVLELPIDALVLEQGRKGYDIDPVEIRKRVGPKFCLFGFGYENDYCTFNKEGLTGELQRQIEGAGMNGAFIIGSPIIPPNALPAAVDFYFSEARRLGGV